MRAQVSSSRSKTACSGWRGLALGILRGFLRKANRRVAGRLGGLLPPEGNQVRCPVLGCREGDPPRTDSSARLANIFDRKKRKIIVALCRNSSVERPGWAGSLAPGHHLRHDIVIGRPAPGFSGPVVRSRTASCMLWDNTVQTDRATAPFKDEVPRIILLDLVPCYDARLPPPVPQAQACRASSTRYEKVLGITATVTTSSSELLRRGHKIPARRSLVFQPVQIIGRREY